MKKLLLTTMLTLISTQAVAQVSDEARAHVKCFANLTQALFTALSNKLNVPLVDA